MEGSEAIYDLLDQIGQSVPLHLYHVTHAELAVKVTGNAERASKQHSIRLSYPDSCSLKHDAMDLNLRVMLAASGIEPRPSDQATTLRGEYDITRRAA